MESSPSSSPSSSSSSSQTKVRSSSMPSSSSSPTNTTTTTATATTGKRKMNTIRRVSVEDDRVHNNSNNNNNNSKRQRLLALNHPDEAPVTTTTSTRKRQVGATTTTTTSNTIANTKKLKTANNNINTNTNTNTNTKKPRTITPQSSSIFPTPVVGQGEESSIFSDEQEQDAQEQHEPQVGLAIDSIIDQMEPRCSSRSRPEQTTMVPWRTRTTDRIINVPDMTATTTTVILSSKDDTSHEHDVVGHVLQPQTQPTTRTSTTTNTNTNTTSTIKSKCKSKNAAAAAAAASSSSSWWRLLGGDTLVLLSLLLAMISLGAGIVGWNQYNDQLSFPNNDCIYVSGGGFSGFWFSLGRLYSTTNNNRNNNNTNTNNNNNNKIAHGSSSSSRSHMTSTMALTEQDNSNSNSNNSSNNYVCYSAGCLGVVAALSNHSMSDVYRMASTLQRQWNEGDLHRYYVVETFVDQLLQHGNAPVVFDDPKVLSQLNILTTSMTTLTSTSASSTSSSSSSSSAVQAKMQTPTNIQELRRLLVQTTWIPLAVGSELAHQGHLDGAFSIWQHPTCHTYVGLAPNLELMLHTLNVNLGQSLVEKFWNMGLEYGL